MDAVQQMMAQVEADQLKAVMHLLLNPKMTTGELIGWAERVNDPDFAVGVVRMLLAIATDDANYEASVCEHAAQLACDLIGEFQLIITHPAR